MQLGRLDDALLDCSSGAYHIFAISAQKLSKELLITFVHSLGSETDVCPKFGGKTAKNWSWGLTKESRLQPHSCPKFGYAIVQNSSKVTPVDFWNPSTKSVEDVQILKH